ncbi:MAG: hypothetical protein ACHQII_06870 [Bacteroidia bacterium]
MKTPNIFFWRKTPAEKAEEMIQAFISLAPKIKETLRDISKMQLSDGQLSGVMYDYYKNWDEHIAMPVDRFDELADEMDAAGTFTKPTDNRIVATPLSVMKELETVPTPFTLDGLDEKIATMKDKSKLLNQRYAKEQIDGLCKRLENRKKYRENVEFYDGFPNTTDEKIDDLLAKYKLVIDTSDLFIPTFPKEAIDIMKKYTEVTLKVSGETPVYYVIAEEKDFKKKREKLDPILLAQSPFGFYWQILGAWDKEMLLLHEL